jgi:hypothetical protein
MFRVTRATLIWTFASALLIAGCAVDTSNHAPAAPKMPSSWRVTSDMSFIAADIEPISKRLGGLVAKLRNTTYDVEGKPIKLNTIIAATPEDADKIMASLRSKKPDDFLHRNGLTIYEFVGTDYVIPDIHAGKVFLQAATGS